jgi:valyl-tRNA synthetase
LWIAITILRPALLLRFRASIALRHHPNFHAMALNAASHNILGEKTAPVSGEPPAVSNDTKAAILQAAGQDKIGQSAPGQDGGDSSAPKKEKTAKELEKERQKAEKAKKFAEKQAKLKQAAAAAPTPKTAKKEKAKEEELPPYVEETPEGQKKSMQDAQSVPMEHC